MIKNIIFDIGNVLIDFAWEPFYRSFGFSEEIVERLANATVRTDIWNEFDRGEWSTERILDAFIANDPDLKEEIHRVFADISEILITRDYVIPWLQDLKKRGYQVFYLSNMGEFCHVQCREKLAFMDVMDGGILSYELCIIKPDVRIYQALLNKYALKAEECVFIDDNLGNVKAAEALGLYGIHALNHSTVLQELQKLGI